jgi:hypothetical protein
MSGFRAFGFPSQVVFHCCLSQELPAHLLCAAMLIVLWMLRIELTHQELGLLCLVHCLGAFLWAQGQ